MTAHTKKPFNVRSLRRRQFLKKSLKVTGNDDDSMNSTSSTTIAGSLASALNIGLVSIAQRKKPDLRSELKGQGIQGVDTKLLQELGEDNVDKKIIGEEIAQLSEEYDLRAITWRQRMVHFLHTMPVEVFMMFLVVLDVLLVLGMMVLDMYIAEENLDLVNEKGTEVLKYLNQTWPNVEREIVRVSSIDEAYTELLHHINSNKTLSGSTRHKRAAPSSGPPQREDFGQYDTYILAKRIHTSLKANNVLHYCSIAILAVFVVEVLLKIIGYGKSYFTNKWEVIDGIVIIISFSLDWAVTDVNFTQGFGQTVLIVFLIWRVIRILNAMVLTSRARTMFRLRVLRKSKKLAEDKNKQYALEAADLQAEVKRLRGLAKSYGADEQEIVSAQVLSKTSVSSTKAGLKNMMAQLLHINTKIATVSCSSLNKLNVTGYNRSRRPSMIGDETMCHDLKQVAAVQSESGNSQFRQRAASDAGGLTRISKKVRDGLSELKKKRFGSGKISQAGSVSNIEFEVYDEPPILAEAALRAQRHTVIDETTESETERPADNQCNTPAPNSSKSAFNRTDSGVIIVDQSSKQEVGKIETGKRMTEATRGHSNSAFEDDEGSCGENDSTSSSGENDSGNISEKDSPGSSDLPHRHISTADGHYGNGDKMADGCHDIKKVASVLHQETKLIIEDETCKTHVSSRPPTDVATSLPAQLESNGLITREKDECVSRSALDQNSVISSPASDRSGSCTGAQAEVTPAALTAADGVSSEENSVMPADNSPAASSFRLPKISITSVDDTHTVLM